MTTIFTLEARDKSLGATLVEARERVRRLNAELKNAQEGSEEYHRLAAQIAQTKKQISEVTEKQKELNRELKSTQVPKDSLAGLRLEYSKLVRQIADLSAAQRQSDFGKALIAQASAAKAEIDKVEQSVGRFTGNVGNYKSAWQGFLPIMSRVGIVFGGLFAALQGSSEIVNTTREFDRLFATLKQATGTETAARKIFDEIQTFAAETPFQLNEVVGAFIKLENRNFNPTIEQLRTMGDIATSQGKSLNQFVEAILDAQTGEFERLKEFGIVARKQGDDVRISFRGQTQVIANTAETLSDYLLGLGKLPGIAGASIAVSKTLDGTLSNLSDNFSRMFATIGSSGGTIQRLAQYMNDAVGAVNDWLDVPLSETLQTQQGEFNALVGALISYTEEGERTADFERVRGGLITEINSKYGDYLGNLDLNKASEEELRTLMDAANKEFERRIFLQVANENSAKLFRVVTAEAEKLTAALKEQGKVVGERRQPVAPGETIGAPTLRATEAGLQTGIEGATAQVEAQEDRLKSARKEFDEYQNTVQETAKVLFGSLDAFNKYRDAQSDTGEETNKGGQKAKFAADSIKALQERVSALREKLDSAPQNQIPGILGDLVKAERELKAVQELIEKLRGSDSTGNTLADLRQKVSELNTELVNAPREQIPAILGNLVKAEQELKSLEDRIAELRIGPQAPTTQEIELQIQDIDSDAVQKRVDELFAGLNPPPIEIPIEAPATEAELLKIIEFNDARLASEELTTEEINRLRASLTDANLDRLRKEAEAEAEREKERQEFGELALEQGLELAGQIAAGVADIERSRVEKQKQASLDAAETEYNERLKKAAGNSKKEAQIKADFEKKKEAIERDAAKKRKQIAITEALIQGALAVVKALPNYVLAAFVAAATAIQVAIMQAQEFAEGGFTDKVKKAKVKVKKLYSGSLAPQNLFDAMPSAALSVSEAESLPDMSAGGFSNYTATAPDRTGRRPAGVIPQKWGTAIIHEGEYVGPASQVQRYPALFAALEADRVANARPFAAGGFTTNLATTSGVSIKSTAAMPLPEPSVGGSLAVPIPSAKSFLQPGQSNTTQAVFSGEQIQDFARQVAIATANEVRRQIRSGLAEGLDDNYRTLERRSAFDAKRTI